MESLDIPVLDLRPEIDSLWDELQAAIAGVLRSGQFIIGPNVAAFEQELAQYLGVRHAIGLNSGTDALFIALRALGIGPGDQVITTPFTFFATAEAISHVGAEPVFVDISPDTFNIDPARIRAAITPRTRAIIAVHIFGAPCDMDSIMAVAREHGLDVIEDAAQAFGARYSGTMIGTIGRIGCLSFFPTKNLGAFGDGGALVTNDDKVAELARMLRAHGSKRKYHNEIVGYNSRLDEIQAAILRVKLPHVDSWNELRRSAADRYRRLLSANRHVAVQAVLPNSEPVYHQFCIRIKGSVRDAVRTDLAGAGISTMVYYPLPVDRLPPYSGLSAGTQAAFHLSNEILALPIWPMIDDGLQATVVRRLLESLDRRMPSA